MTRKKIYVCAPYSGTLEEMLHNRKLTIERCRALYEMGYNPIAPQLHYPTFLNEDDPEQRRFGLDAALDWLKHCDIVYVYGDRITFGMYGEIELAKKLGIPINHITDEKSRP